MYVNDIQVHTTAIRMPEYNPGLSFSLNLDIRRQYVRREIDQFKMDHWQLLEVHPWEIWLVNVV